MGDRDTRSPNREPIWGEAPVLQREQVQEDPMERGGCGQGL